jgi:hypothetical protein
MEHPDKSTVAEHRVSLDLRIELLDSGILSTKSRYMDWMIREAIEIVLHSENMNKEDGLCLTRSWKPLSTLEGCINPHKNVSAALLRIRNDPGYFLLSSPTHL